MGLDSVKNYLQQEEEGNRLSTDVIDGMPPKFIQPLIMQGLHLDLVEVGRIVCSMKVPSRLLNTENFLHGGATATLVDLVGSAVIYTVGKSYTGVSVELSVSYLDSAYVGEEIEIEAKALRVGKAIAVVTVEFRKKQSGKIIAQGRLNNFLAVTSKI
ncbi:acyl-coenzyme A thioesterase 13-like [Impatiens glandulifera]|uniref:acyl-coenzyme A thioesterase 13-like n=1 Tax=Impatiens glandulifera TaxID=253017 RepID=UPI001FB08A43|nr:acyl-coenzyme A thioesterase 13-like [Impatiens glandulifera]